VRSVVSTYNQLSRKEIGGTMRPQGDGVYEFGLFRLDTREKLLSRERTAVPLEPAQFQVLLVLVREAGHLVTHEHLMDVYEVQPPKIRSTGIHGLRGRPSVASMATLIALFGGWYSSHSETSHDVTSASASTARSWR
jgi:hypothetical protein